MSSYSVQALQEKLNRLSLSQDSIETLSLWVIHHKAYARTSVSMWLDNVLKADADSILILIYLANDILQNSRRKGTEIFHDLFRDPIKQAVALSRGKKIQTSVERMFRIWQERRVYEKAFIKELEQLIAEPSHKQLSSKKQLSKEQPASKEPLPELKLSLLEDAVTELRKFEGELKIKSSHLSHIRIDVSDTSSLSQLKDKSDGGKFSAEFEEASQKLQDYCECLGVEVNERINMVSMLQEAKGHLSFQLAEFQRTAKDHLELGTVVQGLRDKLQQRLKDLERAQQTATSDPTAKEDITDVGDMEIESDTESQDGAMDIAAAASSAVPLQGMAPVPSQVPVNQPRPPQQSMPPTAVLQAPGGFINSQPTSMFQGPVYNRQQPPPTTRAPPPTGMPFRPRPPLNSFQPAAARPQGMQRPPPTSQPPPRFSSAPGALMQTARPRGPPPMQQAVRPLMQGGVRPPQRQGGIRLLGGVRPPQIQGSARPPPLQGGIRPPQIQSGVRPPQLQGGVRPPLQGNMMRPTQTQQSNTMFHQMNTISAAPVRYSSAGPAPSNSMAPSSVQGMQTPATSALGTPPQPLVSAGRLPIPAVPSGAQLQPTGPARNPPQQPIQIETQPQPSSQLSAPAILVSQSAPLGGEGLATSPTGNQSSLDERLKSLMAHKTFTKSLLPDYPDSGSEDAGSRPYSPSIALTDKDKPYSPSANDLVISNTGSPLEVDNDSIPSPPTETATPEDASPSPQLNMDNPILKALYQHESEEGPKEHPVTPKLKPVADSVPFQPQAPSSQATSQKALGSGPSLFSAVDTGLLQSILTNVGKSVAKTSTAVVPDGPPSAPPSKPVVPPHTPEPTTPLQTERQRSHSPVSMPKPSAKTPPSPVPTLPPKSAGVSVKDIKITPTLTSLLDEIFPKLSRSLQERKRKPGGPEPSTPESPLPSTKAPRLAPPARQPSSDGPSIPGGPPVRQPPPTAGARPSFPLHASAGPLMRPQFVPRAPGIPMDSRAPRQLRPPFPAGRPPYPGQLPQNRPPFVRPQARPGGPPFQPNPNHIDHFAPKHPDVFSPMGVDCRPQASPSRNFDGAPQPLRPNFRALLRPRFM